MSKPEMPATTSIDMRMPKRVQFVPQQDITAYELALAVKVIFGFVLGNGPKIESIRDAFEKLPPEAKRHFKVTEHEVFK